MKGTSPPNDGLDPGDAHGKWAVLGIVTLTHVMSSYSAVSIQTLAPFFQSDLGLNHVEIGMLTSVFYAGTFFLSTPLGSLVDRIGEYLVLASGPLAIGLFIALISTAHSFAWVCVLVALAGIGYAGINPATGKAVVSRFPPRGRALAMSMKQNGVPLGGALVAATLPVLASAFGWRNALVFGGAVSLVWVLAIIGFYKRSRGSHADPVRISLGGGRWSHVGSILKNRDIMILSFIMLIFQALQLSLITYFTLFLKNSLSCSIVAAGGIFAVGNLGGLVGRLCWGYLSDFILDGERKLLLIVMAGASALFCLLFFFMTPGISLLNMGILVFLFGFAAMGWPGIFLTLVAELSDSRHAGSAFGVSVAVVSLGVFVGPPTFGYIVDRTGSYSYAWLFFSAAMGAATLLLTLVREPGEEGRGGTRSRASRVEPGETLPETGA